MVEYLKKYKELLKQLEINENEREENKLLLDENYTKWEETKDKKEKLELEIKKLNEEYQNLINKKEKKFFDKLLIIITLVSLAIFILISILNPICFIFAPPILVLIDGIVYMSTFLITKTTSILDKKFKKDKNISNLLDQFNEKENELSNIKTLSDKYSQEVIKYHSKSRALKEKSLKIKNSINKIMLDYAIPIFDEQLNNNQEEQDNKTLSKTRKLKNNITKI